MLDEGQASVNDEFRVFYADRSPWWLIIKGVGMPGHGSKLFDNGAMENLMKSMEVVSKFRGNQFDLVMAGVAARSEVISVNPMYVKAGTPSLTGFIMNMQPSEAEAGFDVLLPPTTDPDLLRRKIADEWASASRNMAYQGRISVIRNSLVKNLKVLKLMIIIVNLAPLRRNFSLRENLQEKERAKEPQKLQVKAIIPRVSVGG
ncbi:hypothetical protein GIB67_008920, partial [Kingdonia uniflora]